MAPLLTRSECGSSTCPSRGVEVWPARQVRNLAHLTRSPWFDRTEVWSVDDVAAATIQAIAAVRIEGHRLVPVGVGRSLAIPAVVRGFHGRLIRRRRIEYIVVTPLCRSTFE